ncbi:DUF799 domain-containing protein [Psychrosphaera sp. F3M07]|uniref:GNA1162 family protein n=1 Tax=Psychrosphaera sp. F3M07 TaxID=2841560 RepID=UPI001C0A5A06|nr:GNA1162 family protein [Psychrosphaera sp. F3M07]MBU2918373.1 DUF799 domain-containing protein [Psychrosphaera sp. F3M07]
MNKYIIVTTFILFLSGCVTTENIGKMEAYPKMYEEKPISIVVLPAINKTTAADATDLFSTTVAQPLAEAGFYVVSIPYVNHVLALEGIQDGAQVRDIPMERFNYLFGADAVLFVTIDQWDTTYLLTVADVTVGLKFELISTKTSEVLWQQQRVIVHETTSNDSGSILFDIIATAVTTATTDYVPIARQVNSQILNTIPLGKYHPRYELDANDSSGHTKKVKH